MEPFSGVLINFEMNILQNQIHDDLMSPKLSKMNGNVKGHKFYAFSGTRN